MDVLYFVIQSVALPTLRLRAARASRSTPSRPGPPFPSAGILSRLILLGLLFQHFTLSAQGAGKYESDLAALFKEVDDTYPFFDLKGIRRDWADAKPRLMEKAKSCATDTEFLGIALEAIRCLRDSHMGLGNNKAPFPQFDKKYFPGISFLPATNNRVIVMAAAGVYASKLKPGTVVTHIDGQDARRWLEDRAKAEWSCENPHYASSPQRTRLFVYRIPLAGPQGGKHTLKYLEEDKEMDLEVSCNVEARGWPHYYSLQENRKTVTASVTYALLPSGAGYMYLRYVRQETVKGMQQALEACPDAKGWIIDLRGIGGGGYDNSLIELLKNLPRPVVALIDAGCISAGETLARDLARFAELMNVHWEHKKQRSTNMSNDQINQWYELARHNGALGGKLIGAGGGGFLMFYAEDKVRLRRAMREAHLQEVRFRFDFEGTKVIAQS